MYVLGISAFYHDSAAVLIKDGVILAAAQEERFTRKKHDPVFPKHAIAYCLVQAGIQAKDLAYVAFYEKPFIKFGRILNTFLAYVPRGLSSFMETIPLWSGEKLWIKEIIQDEIPFSGTCIFPEHHESHAASAFFPSPFQEAAFLTVDGVGEWTTASFGVGSGNTVNILEEMRFPHSLGLLYSAFTYYTGFKVNSGEYKLMGLAPYGEPKYADLILSELIDIKDDGSFKLNMEYFNYCTGLTMVNKKFEKLFGGPPREAESRLTKREMDIACSVQQVTEEVLLRMVRYVHRQTNQKNLCMAGGVALNCVANGRLLREGPFERLWVQPAASDAGCALGAAMFAWYQYLGNSRSADGSRDAQQGSYLGPAFDNEYIKKFLDEHLVYYSVLRDEEIPEKVADLLAGQNAVGWFQGRMEFGPRALGSRSILGDARSAKMQEVLNLRIKFRESFRPFAASVLEEKAGDYFEITQASPYMLLVASVRKEERQALTQEQERLEGIDKLKAVRSSIPAVTHVDYLTRLQTVSEEDNPLYYALIRRFEEKYGCPVIVNTSYNVRGEPIVCTPQEAYVCFMRTNMDYLLMGNFLVAKQENKRLDERDILICPGCGEKLSLGNEKTITCLRCSRGYPIEDGIPRLFIPSREDTARGKVELAVKSFYEDTPFPNYEELEDISGLLQKARKNLFLRLLNEQIPFNIRLLEIGCGTGQLSNFLGVANREVLATDMSMPALKLGQDFKQKNNLKRVSFYQMNLFSPVFRNESFDFVICNGVLHHTKDPFAGFQSISGLVQKGGYILIGVYNKYGRLGTNLRRLVFKMFRYRFRSLDPILQGRERGSLKKEAWFEDQYLNPHESKHTIREVLRWFDATGFEFINSFPKLKAFERFSEQEELFKSNPPGNWLDHFIVQAHLALTGSKEGGLFLMIGRKK